MKLGHQTIMNEIVKQFFNEPKGTHLFRADSPVVRNLAFQAGDPGSNAGQRMHAS